MLFAASYQCAAQDASSCSIKLGHIAYCCRFYARPPCGRTSAAAGVESSPLFWTHVRSGLHHPVIEELQRRLLHVLRQPSDLSTIFAVTAVIIPPLEDQQCTGQEVILSACSQGPRARLTAA